MNNRLKMILPVLAVFVLAALACNFPSSAATPPALNQPIQQVTLEPTILVDQSQGQVSVTLTQDQLTAYLVQALSSGSNAPLSNPSVVLSNGQGQLFGQVKEGPIAADAHVVFTVFVDANSRLGVNIVSAEVGSVPLPSAILDQVTTIVNQNLNQAISNNAPGIKIDSVTIGDGTLTITGSKM